MRWAHSQAGTEALGGTEKIHEWDAATKGKTIPARVAMYEPRKKKKKHVRSNSD